MQISTWLTQCARSDRVSNTEKQTFFRFPETFWSARFCFPTLKSTAVTAGVGFRARWVGNNPITHNLHIKHLKVVQPWLTIPLSLRVLFAGTLDYENLIDLSTTLDDRYNNNILL